eukprot:2566479-Rhodomonas_salina.6
MLGVHSSSRDCSSSEDRAERRAMIPIREDRHRFRTSVRRVGGTHSRKTRGAAESTQVKSSAAVVQRAVGGASSTLRPTIVSRAIPGAELPWLLLVPSADVPRYPNGQAPHRPAPFGTATVRT